MDPTRTSRARRWAIRLGLVLVALALVEVAVRGALLATGRPWSSEASRARLVALRERLHGGLDPDEGRAGESRLQPYVGWWTEHLQERVEEEVAGGASARRFDRRATYDVWILGGSVAAIFAGKVKGGGAVFAETVAADPRFRAVAGGARLRVVDFAHAAHKQPQQAALASLLFGLGLRPDAIVNLDGFNEVAVASANAARGVHPLWPKAGSWAVLAGGAGAAADPDGARPGLALLVDARSSWRAADRKAELGLRFGLGRSAALGLALEAWVRADTADWTRSQERYDRQWLRARGDPTLRGLAWEREYDLDLMTRAWFEGSISLDGMCRARGVRYLHVLQPTLHDDGAKVATEEEQRVGTISEDWLRGVREGYPRLRELGARLRGRGIAFVDASAVFADVQETLYYDACHFDARGNRILAARIAEAFLEMLAE